MHARVVIRIVLNIVITIISFNSIRCFCYFVLLRKLIGIPKLMTSSCFWWALPSTDCWRNKGYYKQNCSVTVCCHSTGTIVCGCVSHQCVSLIVSAPFIFILLSMSRHMTGNLIKWNWISSVVNSQDSSRILLSGQNLICKVRNPYSLFNPCSIKDHYVTTTNPPIIHRAKSFSHDKHTMSPVSYTGSMAGQSSKLASRNLHALKDENNGHSIWKHWIKLKNKSKIRGQNKPVLP